MLRVLSLAISSTSTSIQLRQTIPHILFEQCGVSWVPPTQSGPSFCHITGSPHDPEVVNFILRLVVGDENVEIPAAYTIEHVQNSLLSRPRPRGLLSSEGIGTRHARVCPSRTRGLVKGGIGTGSEDSHEQVSGQIGNRSALA